VRLFDHKGHYNERAIVLDLEVHARLRNLIRDYMAAYPDTDPRDVTLLILNAAASVTNEFILKRKG
jgi:hypothetical protein